MEHNVILHYRWSERDVHTELVRLVKHLGSQKAAAEHLGVSQPYLSDAFHGRESLGGKILTGLGFEEVTERYYIRRLGLGKRNEG